MTRQCGNAAMRQYDYWSYQEYWKDRAEKEQLSRRRIEYGLEMIFPVNVVHRRHLDFRIPQFDMTLEDWILSSPRHGQIDSVTAENAIWTVPVNDLPDVVEQLWGTDLIPGSHLFQYGGFSHDLQIPRLLARHDTFRHRSVQGIVKSIFFAPGEEPEPCIKFRKEFGLPPLRYEDVDLTSTSYRHKIESELGLEDLAASTWPQGERKFQPEAASDVAEVVTAADAPPERQELIETIESLYDESGEPVLVPAEDYFNSNTDDDSMCNRGQLGVANVFENVRTISAHSNVEAILAHISDWPEADDETEFDRWPVCTGLILVTSAPRELIEQWAELLHADEFFECQPDEWEAPVSRYRTSEEQQQPAWYFLWD